MTPKIPGIDALLFDLGNVVVRIEFSRIFGFWANRSGQTIDTIRSRFSFDVFYERYERGEICRSEYFDSLRRSLKIRLSDEELAEGWASIFTGEILGMRSLLQRLASQVPLYVFTNTNECHEEVWRRIYAETLGCFQKIFTSHAIGMREPEPAAFAKIAAAIGVRPNQVLFFEDLYENVEGARAIGMEARLVRSIEDIEQAVVEWVPSDQRQRTPMPPRNRN